MIHNVLSVVANELNNYLNLNFQFDEKKVLVSNLVNQDGTLAFEGSNKVVLTLLNIEEEGSLKSNMGIMKPGAKKELHVNMEVIFTSFFTGKNYIESLKIVSQVILFFNQKKVFTPNNTPDLYEKSNKLIFELQSYSLQELSHIWGMLGAKYMPSVIYKVSMLTFSNDIVFSDIPEIRSF
ncbi:DUF4255 domain-containing protein [Aureibacter tunicatorum]|uniref:Pvc16 N-terminal domain-containing protein n=1 Tax=Aureibacter tunicatorum TaxID=866807 RepID=A0AAE3XS79_9BACT|nr:DUF4255 domain-containing protein [Aureibacter tunicatorum]MDR6241657.1 hypothetical protein [Aureibacter tunicatorum]BDD07357.1 hypothetical protein AUTU_48400 [Aureibacter tunicatorum]